MHGHYNEVLLNVIHRFLICPRFLRCCIIYFVRGLEPRGCLLVNNTVILAVFGQKPFSTFLPSSILDAFDHLDNGLISFTTTCFQVSVSNILLTH